MRGHVAVGICLTAFLIAPQNSSAGGSFCNLVRDAAQDANENPAVGGDVLRPPAGSSPAADVITADLAADGRVLTAVVRLSGPPAADDLSPMGYLYLIRFDLGGTTFALYGKTGVDGDEFAAGTVAGPVNPPASREGPPVTGVMDLARRRVVIHAPWTILEQISGKKLRRGTASGISVQTYRNVGSKITGTTTVLADEANAQQDYPIGARSCVRPGIG